MRSTLYLKFIGVYIVFAFLSVFTVSTLGSRLILTPLTEEISSNLYRDANVTASDYLPRYFSDQITQNDVRTQLDGMREYLDASLWFVDRQGNMIQSSSYNGETAPRQVEDFDPAEAGGSQYLTGSYHGYFDQEMITVIAPVVSGYSTSGYLLIHKSMDDILSLRDIMMRAAFITLAVIFVLSFIILLAFHFIVYRPLRIITDAATQYASGNLDYEIPIHSEDEMGYLSASLNYMSSQLKDMENYQKKFVANVSHDFRSPLTSIKGYVEAIADGTIPPEEQDKYLNIILFETERLTDLTEDLLTLGEFDSDTMILDRQSFDIHEMIKNVAASFEGICTQRRISIELVLATAHLNVYADERKIQQVLYNLLDNAIKFSDDDSVVTIETTERGEKVSISVKDNGAGIARSDLNKIWDRFYKTDASRGRDKKGTGLGLAIVKEAIQAHGENINVISTEGVGTEFVFTLPKAQA